MRADFFFEFTCHVATDLCSDLLGCQVHRAVIVRVVCVLVYQLYGTMLELRQEQKAVVRDIEAGLDVLYTFPDWLREKCLFPTCTSACGDCVPVITC